MPDDIGRAAVRRLYEERCGYCTVHESEAGTELEVDHFQPRTAHGSDELSNLVYCCTTCNRFKGDFWPVGDFLTTIRRILHPKRDDLSQHLQLRDDGVMLAMGETGSFHLERLRLNRPPLIALRQARSGVAHLRQELEIAQQQQRRLRQRIDVG